MNWARWWSGSTSQISPYGALNLDADRCNIVKINRCSDPEYTIRLKKDSSAENWHAGSIFQ